MKTRKLEITDTRIPVETLFGKSVIKIARKKSILLLILICWEFLFKINSQRLFSYQNHLNGNSTCIGDE